MTTNFELEKTALVMIDLQKGIALNPHLAPYSSQQVLAKNQALVEKFANTPALIVCVKVENYGPEALKPWTDEREEQAAAENTSVAPLPADFSDFVLPVASDTTTQNVIQVKKHNWGAFYGTDLEVQLRRRNIDTIILTGVATGRGVDTTAREAMQRGFKVIAVEDAMTDFDTALHQTIVQEIFPKLGRVRQTSEILATFADWLYNRVKSKKDVFFL